MIHVKDEVGNATSLINISPWHYEWTKIIFLSKWTNHSQNENIFVKIKWAKYSHFQKMWGKNPSFSPNFPMIFFSVYSQYSTITSKHTGKSIV